MGNFQMASYGIGLITAGLLSIWLHGGGSAGSILAGAILVFLYRKDLVKEGD